MEDILAIVLIFGGGTLIALAMSPIGRAIAARIQGGGGSAASDERLRQVQDSHQALLEDLEVMRRDLTELQERVDFAERLLAKQRDEPRLPGSAAS